MRHSFRRLLILVVLFTTVIPAGAVAQQAGTATPEPVSTYDLTLIGVARTGGAPGTSSDAEGADALHAVQLLDIDPGATVPQLRDVRSVVISGQAGEVRVTTDAEALVSVGTGDPVRSEDGSILCEALECEVDAGSAVMIGVGNGISVSSGTLEFAVVGDEPASLLVSLLIPAGALGGRCWACPVVIP